MANGALQFLLNDEIVTLDHFDPNLTVLQYLRNIENKTGTKEGCASGDCGACTVVVAELSNTSTDLAYKSINSCITFLGAMHGKQLITVEHLKPASQLDSNEKLHSVQQNMVDHHASQCGFCTPGFVMSSFALHKNKQNPDREEVLEALAGNLCRCTGYRSIIDAAIDQTNDCANDSFAQNYQQTVDKLSVLNQLPAVQIQSTNKSYFAPKNSKELSTYLLAHPDAILVAGGTDLALSVTQHLSSINELVYLGEVEELNTITVDDEFIHIGSAVPYHKFTHLLEKEYSDLGDMIERIGSMQIRNNGTLGGNIGNASPIGDMPPALISLGCTMELQCGDKTRTVLVEDYFVDYKKTILAPSEFIKSISIPRANKPKAEVALKVYKISKRIDDDISAVLASFYIELKNNQVTAIRIAFGGMAAIPKRALATEQVLLNNAFTKKNIERAQQALTQDYQPMSDVRASDAYRMRVAQNLLEKCFIELTQSSASSTPHQLIETRVINHA
ncbi:xanthine dehydrogenase small subunit [Colwellia sp. RE-S-Sl-9]